MVSANYKMSHHSLSGLRILVVEDEPMIVMLLEDMLGDLDCVLVGPAYRTDAALNIVQSERLDAAILDVNLGGQCTTVVAEALQAKGVPFVFATGYGAAGVTGNLSQSLVLTKPFTQPQLENALRSLCARRPS